MEDYSINWAYIVSCMRSKGIDTNSTEPHEMGFFLQKLDEIFSEFCEKKRNSFTPHQTITP